MSKCSHSGEVEEKVVDNQCLECLTFQSRSVNGEMTSVYGDRIIPAEYFHLCPLNFLEPEGFCTDQWSASSGGLPVENGQWTIDVWGSGTGRKRTRWIVPEALLVLFNHFSDCGANKKMRDIKRALDI